MNMLNAKRYTRGIDLAERNLSVKLNSCLHIDVSTDKSTVQFKSSTRGFSIKKSRFHVLLHINRHLSQSFTLVVFFLKYFKSWELQHKIITLIWTNTVASKVQNAPTVH